ncbi:MAG: serine/threonine-protein kinase, partial [Planctomycetia bacterium]|nr:serine/threonine-protein kinase [Planctomycetia bacterium]
MTAMYLRLGRVMFHWAFNVLRNTMATNVAGSGKPSPHEPDPKTKLAGAGKPSAASDGKPPISSSKSTATGGKTAQPDVSKAPAKSKTGFNELNDLKKIGRYEIIKKIGQGGMGAVFLAKDTQLKRQVALKVLPRDKAENPTLVRRFKAEAQAAAALKHDNIVAIHDAGEADGLLYIALEYIEGTDAHSIVAKRGPMPVKRAMEVIRQTAAALQHAHEQKIVHRDIKPSNLLIRKDGLTKLADMGLARSIDESVETNITRAGTTVGTVDYMSPEQARNSKAADIRSDLYSLGATWYHLLAGHPPFPDGSMLNKLTAHSAKARPDIRDLNESVPENISVMIKRMMAVKPEDRYQTPQELLDDLGNDNLTRGPMTLKDLAALAEEDDDEEEDHHAPKAAYKKPGAQEAKQLMAPTMELP